MELLGCWAEGREGELGLLLREEAELASWGGG